MARWDHLQSDFSRGELSPLMAGRRDSPDFSRGLALCQNAIIGQRGEWVRRPGTRHVRDTIGNAPVRLVEMITAEQHPILLEFGERSLRLSVYDDENFETFVVPTPYVENQIWGLDWAQSGNSLFVVHSDHPPQWLHVDVSGTWRFEPLALVDGPYLRLNSNPQFTLTADGAGVFASVGFAPFVGADVGRAIRFRDGQGLWHHGVISAHINNRRVDVVWSNPDSAAANGDLGTGFEWQLGAFWRSNYPTSVCFHEDRLVFAATLSNPQSFWASHTGDYTHFGPSEADGDVLASNAIFAALNDRQINRIQWLVSAQESLVAGTASGLWLVNSGGGIEALAPSNVQAQRLSGANSADVRPTSVGRSTLFVERSGRRLLALKRDTVELVYLTPDISLRSEHLLTSGIDAMAFQAVPWSTNWCLMNNGMLAGLTMIEQDEVQGWHQHRIAGPSARVMSIATLPGVRQDNSRKQDQLFMVVERTLVGGKRYSIEVLGDGFEHDTDLADAEYLDGARKAQSSTAFSYVGGLGHLEGLTLEALSDGRPVPGGVVRNGGLSVGATDAGNKLLVGLPYSSQAELLDIDATSITGQSDGKPRHVYEMTLRLWRSVSVEASLDGRWVGYRGDDERRNHDPSGTGPNGRDQPYSGGLRIKRDAGGWSRQLKAGWRTQSPLPLAVLSVLLRFQDSDG